MMNDPERIVDEALEGLVATTPGITAVDNHRVVVRSDLEAVRGKVAVICGGGSGHEPAFAGYVGKGCLAAAIAGSVFASPPPTSILAAIMTVAEHKPSGILVVRARSFPSTLGRRAELAPQHVWTLHHVKGQT